MEHRRPSFSCFVFLLTCRLLTHSLGGNQSDLKLVRSWDALTIIVLWFPIAHRAKIGPMAGRVAEWLRTWSVVPDTP